MWGRGCGFRLASFGSRMTEACKFVCVYAGSLLESEEREKRRETERERERERDAHENRRCRRGQTETD